MQRKRIARFDNDATAERLARLEALWKDTFPYMPIGLFELVGAPGSGQLPTSWAAEPARSGAGS